MARRRPTPAAAAANGRMPSAWSLADTAIEQALLTGERPSELDALFGEAGHDELASLARQAAARRRRGGPKVLILPGIMGSKLGRKHSRFGIAFDDVYWLDPLDFAFGVARKLALDASGDAAIEPLGVFLSTYLKLKLSLIVAGYDADFYPYDWRRNIRDLGQGLARYLRGLGLSGGRRISLVAHSMGGLVARAAMQAGAEASIQRLIMLGTPSFGSFAPVQALRGVLSTVKQLAALDLTANPTELAEIFGTFVGLCQMLPAAARFSGLDFFDAASWPSGSGAIRPAVLREARDVQAHLAVPPHDNAARRQYFLIAGYNQPTVVGATRSSDERDFRYLTSPHGDGTVPLELARLDNAVTYYVEERHGSLPNHGDVIRAVKDILAQGQTSDLASSPAGLRSVAVETVREASLREALPLDGRRGRALRIPELREVLEPFAAPLERARAALAPATVAAGTTAEVSAGTPVLWSKLTVSRPRQHRLEIHLANGSITDIDARAYVLGVFREVTPSGAAAAVDRHLGGAIAELTQRRMMGANVGEVFVLPANRSQLRTDMVVFAGLGPFDGFNDDVQRITAENVARLLIRTRVENLATVLMGAGSEGDIPRAVENILRGFLRAIRDVDADQNFRRVTVCELDPNRYQSIRESLYRLASTPLFDEFEVSFTELRAVPSAATVFVTPQDAERQQVASLPEPIYLVVRQGKLNSRSVSVSSSLLPPSSKAAILSDSVVIENARLNEILAELESESLTFHDVDAFGQRWAEQVLPPSIAVVLPRHSDRHLVVVHDADSSRFPWETLHLAGWSPARSGGLSHRYLADNLSVAKYLEQRRREETLRLLLIIDPTETLDGAVREADRIDRLVQNYSAIQVDTIRGREGTRQAIWRAISSGKYDVLHYAGHAAFNPLRRSDSGIQCAQGEVLSGADLSRAEHLPSLVFFNACESARVRGKRPRKGDPGVEKLKQMQVGFAEAFLRGGVANYVGTYWPVGDAPAEAFGVAFYGNVLAGQYLGGAVLAARRQIHASQELDWADYIHYGDHRFQVKLPRS